MTAVQENATSIRVAWTPPSPLGDTIGYRISFTGGGTSGSFNVSGPTANQKTLTNLNNGGTYSIIIVATSTVLVSENVATTAVPLGK